MPRRRTRNDWRVSNELHRRVVGVVSRGGVPDTITNEIHDIYLRYGHIPGPAAAEILRCPDHPSTALENGRCPICQRSTREIGRPAIRNDVRVSREIHRAVVAAITGGGNVDTIFKSIDDTYRRSGWASFGPAGLNVSRCRIHTGTALQNGACPICRWNPNGPEN